jgi:hypothetical protein
MRRVDHPRLIAALRRVEDSIDEAWREFCAESGITPGTADERGLAEVVLQDTSEFDWRVVDGALKQLTCPDCGSGLGAGPAGCASCDRANGFRFAAREVDRPVRVGVRQLPVASPRAGAGYELYLRDLLEGAQPTTPEAQRLKALINELTDDELEQLLTPADLQPKDA